MKNRLLAAVGALAAAVQIGAASAKTFDVSEYGAKGDGATLDTAAIQRAIDAAEKAGGGTVALTKGTYLSGTVYLKDNITFQLAEGATLKGCTNHEEYCTAALAPQNWASSRKGDNTSGGHLVVALGRKNVSIVGPGKIDGSGPAFLLDENGKQWPNWKAGIPWRPGQMVWICNCEDVKIENVELADSPYWTCNLLSCDRVNIRGCRIHNERKRFNTWNGDGIDIDRCRDVTISDCDINTTDDSITLRASCGGYYAHPHDCECVTVTNCRLASSCNAIRIGVGEGHIHDATFRNITIHDSRIAINFVGAYSPKSRGTDIDNILLTDFDIDAQVFVKMYHRFAEFAVFRDIEFRNMRGKTQKDSAIDAKPTMPFRNIRFNNIDIPCGVKVNNAEIKINGGSLKRLDGLASGAGLVANPEAFDARALAPVKVMDRDYWTLLWATGFSDPAYPLSEKQKANGVQDLAFLRDCALYYSFGRKDPKDPALASWRKMADNAPGGANSVEWKAFEQNSKPMSPAFMMCWSKRSYQAQVGKIDLDMDEYREIMSRHPNLFAYYTLDEWSGDWINMRGRLKAWKTQAERDELLGRLYRFPKTREGTLAGLKAHRDHQVELYWGDVDRFGVLSSCCAVNDLVAAWGAKYISFETTDTMWGDCDYRWSVCGPFIRGVARQFNIPWCWYLADYYDGFTKDGKAGGSTCEYIPKPRTVENYYMGPEGGVSASLLKRGIYYAYLNGANFIQREHWNKQMLTRDEQGQTILSSRGRDFAAFHDFTKAHPDRGTPYAPVAILTAFGLGYHMWGGETLYGAHDEGYRAGDQMTDGVFFTLVPGCPRMENVKRGIENCMHNSQYAMMHDVLVPDSPQAEGDFLARLSAYPVAILTGAYPDLAVVWKRLDQYVKSGGTVLAPRANLTAELRERLAGMTGVAVLDGEGATMATAYDIGKGRLVVSQSEWMTPPLGDQNKTIAEIRSGARKFPEIAYFLKRFQDELLPFAVDGQCLYGANKTKDGWWLWALNNDGVTKFIDAVEQTDPDKAHQITVGLKGNKFKAVRELRSGKEVALENGGFRWTIPAGDLAIFELRE